MAVSFHLCHLALLTWESFRILLRSLLARQGSHTEKRSNYSDLTRPRPKWWFSIGNPLISGKSRFQGLENMSAGLAWGRSHWDPESVGLLRIVLMDHSLHVISSMPQARSEVQHALFIAILMILLSIDISVAHISSMFATHCQVGFSPFWTASQNAVFSMGGCVTQSPCMIFVKPSCIYLT